MLIHTYYAQNYAGIIYLPLIVMSNLEGDVCTTTCNVLLVLENRDFIPVAYTRMIAKVYKTIEFEYYGTQINTQ